MQLQRQICDQLYYHDQFACRKKGIIENWLSDNDAVLSVVHNLDKEILIFLYNFYFSEIVEDLNKYCRKRRHKWKACLKQKYFRNPWAIISVIAAAILLMLTVIQTACSIIQVVQVSYDQLFSHV